MKSAVVVADTSPLIALAVMDLLPVLNVLFKTVLVPSAVVTECLDNLSKPKATVISSALSDKLLIEQSVDNRSYCALLANVLGPGEAEAIALAKELNVAALIDERAARAVAIRENITCIGSFYVLIKAKQKNLIPAAAPLLTKLIDHGYHVSDALINYVLDVCDEIPLSK
ncbi:MAG: DUF3368 domain-containing protein [Aestuariibacter sp.]|nr:DUF3368 domain-containing protein [Aestuariibacter sp.]